MRRRNQKDYPFKAKAFEKNYDTETISDIPLHFRYANYEGKKSKFVQEQLIEGFISTDEGRMIITSSSIDFKSGWKVEISNIRYEIVEIGVSSDETLKYGSYRNRNNRDLKVLVLS